MAESIFPYQLLVRTAFVELYFHQHMGFIHCHVLPEFRSPMTERLNAEIVRHLNSTQATGVLMDLAGLADFETILVEPEKVTTVQSHLKKIAYYGNSYTLQTPGVQAVIAFFSQWYQVRCFTKFSQAEAWLCQPAA